MVFFRIQTIIESFSSANILIRIDTWIPRCLDKYRYDGFKLAFWKILGPHFYRQTPHL